MEYITLGNSNLKVSQLGFGCDPMGGHAWGKVSEDELQKAVYIALDNGVNFFDTADIYGYGKSEEILGKLLKGRRSETTIATKFGVRIDSQGKTFYDNSREWIEKALDKSLQRLDVNYIDLYQTHYLDDKTPLADVIEVLEKKRLEGKILYYGFSNISLIDINNCTLPKEAISFQVEYSLANRSHEEEILKIHERKHLGFLSWGSLGQGILSGKYNNSKKFSKDDRRSKTTYINFHGEKLKKNLLIVNKMKTIFENTGKTLPQIAIRWILDYLSFGIVLVGIKNTEQIIENVGAFGWNLTKDEIDSLDSISI